MTRAWFLLPELHPDLFTGINNIEKIGELGSFFK